MLKKLHTKFICVNMLIVLVMLCIIFGLVFRFTAEDLEAESTQALQILAAAYSRPENHNEPVFPDNPSKSAPPNIPAEPKKPDELRSDVRLPYFEITVDRQNNLSASGTGYFDLTDEVMLKQIVDAVQLSGQQTGKLESFHLRFLITGTPKGERYIFVDTSGEDATMYHLIGNSIIIAVLSIILFFGLSILFARWAIKPVEQAWDQQKQFVADASHELKTPLTVIMTSAELLQEPAQSDEVRQGSIARILTMSHQMRDLVEGLLDLARADNGTSKMAFSDADLSQVIETALLTFEPLYFEQGLTLQPDIQEGIRLNISSDHIFRAAEILLDNAMKYSTPGGTIRVTLRCHGSSALLSVASPGQTISSADLKNIFKRFYRLDKARGRDGSYGLGLPIAQAIVTAHKGKIWAESHDGTNTFHIQLPM